MADKVVYPLQGVLKRILRLSHLPQPMKVSGIQSVTLRRCKFRRHPWSFIKADNYDSSLCLRPNERSGTNVVSMTVSKVNKTSPAEVSRTHLTPTTNISCPKLENQFHRANP